MRIARDQIRLSVIWLAAGLVACTASPIVTAPLPPSVAPPVIAMPSAPEAPQPTPTCNTPTLVGEVFETSGGTRRLVPNLWMAMAPADEFSEWVQGGTNAEGRYAFCGVKLGLAYVAAGNCNEAIVPSVIEIRPGQNMLHIDVTWLNDCPGLTGL